MRVLFTDLGPSYVCYSLPVLEFSAACNLLLLSLLLTAPSLWIVVSLIAPLSTTPLIFFHRLHTSIDA